MYSRFGLLLNTVWAWMAVGLFLITRDTGFAIIAAGLLVSVSIDVAEMEISKTIKERWKHGRVD